ncbi:ankyrin repeat domain-containing protein [Bdellovibrio sp. HCB337]|uniref:ankyrin repeat domain-containing protein n=1 Tax=Bdellovibrio sp. HCB337 TaxID=3394358 RepID=UPI0039A6F03D
MTLVSLLSVFCISLMSVAEPLSLEMALEAANTGNVQILKKYSAEQSNLNKQNNRGINLLMQAAASGQTNVIDYLLQQKVDLELKTSEGDTAVVMAITNDQDAIAEKLIKAGAKKEITNGDGKKPLDLAKEIQNEEAIKLLK